MPNRNGDELPLIVNSEIDPLNDKVIIWDDSATGIDRTKAAVVEESKRIFAPGQYLSNNTGSTIAKGSPVYISSSQNVSLANANSNTTYNLIGLAQYNISTSTTGFIQSAGVLTATTTEWDSVTGGSGGLTAGSIYYLSDSTAGRLTSTAPTTLNHWVCEVGTALNSTELLINLRRPVRIVVGSQRLTFNALTNRPPSANAATLNSRNSRIVLEFSAASTNTAVFSFDPLRTYNGGGLRATLLCTMATGTTGDVVVTGEIERVLIGTDTIDSDSFASAVSTTTTIPGVNGRYFLITINFTNSQIDGLTSSDFFRLRISRLGADAADTATGLLQFITGDLIEV